MKTVHFVLAIIIAVLLPLAIVPTLNHYMFKPKVSALSKAAIQQDVQKLKVPDGWLSKIPAGLRDKLPQEKQKLAEKAGKAQQKYIAPQIQKYHEGRLAIMAGIGVLILLVLILGRYASLAWGLGVGAGATMLIAFISTWSYIGTGFRWLLLPAIVLFVVWALLTWRTKR